MKFTRRPRRAKYLNLKNQRLFRWSGQSSLKKIENNNIHNSFKKFRFQTIIITTTMTTTITITTIIITIIIIITKIIIMTKTTRISTQQ